MAPTYKVWIEIEEIDENGDGMNREDLNADLRLPPEFWCVEDAVIHARRLSEISKIIAED